MLVCDFLKVKVFHVDKESLYSKTMMVSQKFKALRNAMKGDTSLFYTVL